MELRRPQQCPKCGSSRFVEIVYGRPTPEATEAALRGELALGGCFITQDQPDWECSHCRHRWLDAKDPERIKRDRLIEKLREGNLNEQEE